mgnify:CR=1 FL=1
MCAVDDGGAGTVVVQSYSEDVKFTLHDQNSAPEAAKALLEKSHKAFGRVPGLHAVMAESPELLNAYQDIMRMGG